MANCNNPKVINTANVNQFGFSVVFDPYNKKAIFDISGYTIFETGGQANISDITFVLTDPLGEEHTLTIDPSNNELDGEITGLSQAVLFFGLYNVKATLTEADSSTYEINQDYNVCHDDRLTAQNYIASTSNGESCIDVDVDCGRAVMTIYNRANMKYAGLQPITELTTYNGTITYPDNYQDNVVFEYAPYQLNLADSITGLYQVSLLITAYYDLGCDGKVAIQYRGRVNKDVECGAAMCDLNCCLRDALDIISKGGSKGAQMEEKMQLASYWYNAAVAEWACGNNAEDEIAQVKKILGCDCKCQKAVLIQPRPITYNGKNLIPSCGISITENENGDYLFHSFVYQVSPKPGDGKIKMNTVQTNSCTKVTYIELDCAEIERCIYEVLADSSNISILNQWKTLFGIEECSCDEVELNTHIESVNSVITNIHVNKLEDFYFVRNETLLGIVYQVAVTVLNGTIDSIQYHDQMVSNNAQTTDGASQSITIPCNVCSESLIDVEDRDLLINIHTECGCVLQADTPIIVSKIPYSERYDFAYRFNPQIGDAPYIEYNEYDTNGDAYTIREVIFADSAYNSLSASNGSIIRAIKLKTDNGGATTFVETRTLFGREKVGASPTTYNNVWGDQAEFDYASSICLDNSEIVNGYPVLYFVTFGGVICRAVRERDNKCDERANWKIYVINNLGDQFYGIKKWKVDDNGNQTFLVLDNTDSRIKLLNHDGSGSKNSSSNWVLTSLITTVSGANANFNIDGNVIYLLNSNQIKYFKYTGTTALASLQTASNYTTSSHNLTSGAVVTPNSYVDGAGNLASVDMPLALWKEGDVYYFSNARFAAIGSTTNTRGSYIRYFEVNSENPSGPSDYTFGTEIIPNSNSNIIAGTWVAGVSSNISGETMGMCYIEDLGWLSIYQYGVRIFDFTAKTCTLLTGQAGAGQNLDTDGIAMDTQWSYLTT